MEPLEQSQNVEQSRAKEIDTGAFPLSMENVILGLPQKSDVFENTSSTTARPWTFSDIVSQRKLVTTLDVNPATSQSDPLWSFQHTWKNVYDLHFRSLNSLFMLKKWTINFELEFRSNFQQVGMFSLVFCNIPQTIQGYILEHDSLSNFLFQTQLPHRKIFMGEDTNVKTSLKWLSPLLSSCAMPEYRTSNDEAMDDYDMGTLYLYCPFKMQVAAGVDSTMTVRIWSYLTDLEYSGYNIINNL